MSLAPLASPPPGAAEADALLGRLDACFSAGLARLGPDERAALDDVATALAPSPIGPRVAAAVDAFARSEFTPPHAEALAAARTALSGAVHDALLAQAAEVLGRSVTPLPSPKPTRRADNGPTEGARHALLEIALAGWGRLDGAMIAALAGAPARLADAGEPRLAALIAGFVAELPGLDPAEAPLRRLADLWTRAALLAGWAPAEVGEPFAGVLQPIGVELRAHPWAVSLVVHARVTGEPGVVRLHRSAWKVDVMSGVDLFRLAAEPELRAALAGGKLLSILGASRIGPDLSGGSITAGGAADAALDAFLPGVASALTPPPPLDRHPLTLAVPVALPGRLDGSVWKADGLDLPVRFGPADTSPLSPDTLSGDRLLGLLRADGTRWFLAPLAGTDKKKAVISGAAWADGNPKVKAKGDVLAILKERSSRLLRKK